MRATCRWLCFLSATERHLKNNADALTALSQEKRLNCQCDIICQNKLQIFIDFFIKINVNIIVAINFINENKLI